MGKWFLIWAVGLLPCVAYAEPSRIVLIDPEIWVRQPEPYQLLEHLDQAFREYSSFQIPDVNYRVYHSDHVLQGATYVNGHGELRVALSGGTFRAAQNLDQLAGVVAHELAHVINGDLKVMVRAAELEEKQAKGESLSKEEVDFLREQKSERAFHQREFRADRRALRMLIETGFNPHEYISMFSRYEGDPTYELLRKGKGTHPEMKDRVEKMKEFLRRTERILKIQLPKQGEISEIPLPLRKSSPLYDAYNKKSPWFEKLPPKVHDWFTVGLFSEEIARLREEKFHRIGKRIALRIQRLNAHFDLMQQQIDPKTDKVRTVYTFSHSFIDLIEAIQEAASRMPLEDLRELQKELVHSLNERARAPAKKAGVDPRLQPMIDPFVLAAWNDLLDKDVRRWIETKKGITEFLSSEKIKSADLDTLLDHLERIERGKILGVGGRYREAIDRTWELISKESTEAKSKYLSRLYYIARNLEGENPRVPKSGSHEYVSEAGKFATALFVATLLDVLEHKDDTQFLTFFLSLPTEMVRFATFGLGASAATHAYNRLEKIMVHRMTSAVSKNQLEQWTRREFLKHAGDVRYSVLREILPNLKSQVGFMAGLLLNKILFEKDKTDFWKSYVTDAASFMGAQMVVKAATRGGIALASLARYRRLGWNPIPRSGVGGWLFSAAELGVEIWLGSRISRMWNESRARSEAEDRIEKSVRALKRQESFQNVLNVGLSIRSYFAHVPAANPKILENLKVVTSSIRSTSIRQFYGAMLVRESQFAAKMATKTILTPLPVSKEHQAATLSTR